MIILVGVSGGVDSAVALHILKSQGHSVIGAMMKIYDGEIKTIANSCYGTDKKKEALANFTSIFEKGTYSEAIVFMVVNASDVYDMLNDFVEKL